MKRIIIFSTLFLGLSVLFSSCLKQGLEKFPAWDQNDITNAYIEFRYNGSTQYNGQPVVQYQRLTVNQTIDKTAKTIAIKVTVPNAGGQFTSTIRDAVTQSKLIPYFDISTAAIMQGIEGTPNPGNETDLTKPLKYKVTAANGASAIWTITVTSFVK